jgi:hypothetical protein
MARDMATATTREREHVHQWGRVRLEEPPGYMVAAHGAGVLASSRYRVCGCGEQVWHGEVDSPEVLAHLALGAGTEG